MERALGDIATLADSEKRTEKHNCFYKGGHNFAIRYSVSIAESVLSKVFNTKQGVASSFENFKDLVRYSDPSDFSLSYSLREHLAGVARTQTRPPLVEYRISIFIAARSACVAYIFNISRSNDTTCDFRSQLSPSASPADWKVIFTS